MAQYSSLPFDEQIQFFLPKLLVVTQRWDDLWQSAHDKAFTVAGAMSLSILQDFQDTLDDMLTQGLTIDQFRDIFEDIVAKYGWTGWTGEGTEQGRAWRARIIYETNLRTSYSAGRWQQIQEVKSERPYLMYKHSDGEQYPRPLHMQWDNMILPVDHWWWQTHYPPNGFGCKCQAYTLSDIDLEMRNLKITPDDQIVPGDPDAGWGYIMGTT